jgi:uncharacterized protein with PIN domain
LLVDKTAGRLVRWLRILGLDAEYAATCEAAEITRLARQSGRVVITRNRAVTSRLKGRSLLLESEHLGDQIRQVVAWIGWERCDPFSRCSVCNVALVAVPKESLEGRVPEYVYRHHDRFAACPVCGRYYWRGTHCEAMQREIDSLTGGGHNGDEQGSGDRGNPRSQGRG